VEKEKGKNRMFDVAVEEENLDEINPFIKKTTEIIEENKL
jgi:deoxyhypusine synthase